MGSPDQAPLGGQRLEEERRQFGARRRERIERREARLWRIGFEDYDSYLRSTLWSEARSRYWRDPDTRKSCGLCGTNDPPLALHHRTYERVGRERLADLIPVCVTCHALIHALEVRGDIDLDSDPAGLVSPVRAASYRRGQSAPGKPDPRPGYEQERKKLSNHLNGIRQELEKAEAKGKPQERLKRIKERLKRYEVRLAQLERNPGQILDPLSLDYRRRYSKRQRRNDNRA